MVQGRKPYLAIRKRIARLRADGHSGAEIARRLGVSHQAIYPILNGTALRRGAAVCCSCRATILSAQASKQLRGLLCLDCLARSPAAPLGQRLSSLRIIAEMTQAQLSEATGISLPARNPCTQNQSLHDDLRLHHQVCVRRDLRP